MRTLAQAGRRTNVAILAVLAASLVSGVLAFAIGDESTARIVVAAHGVLGLCLVVLTPWKSVIARRGLRRAGRRPGRGTSVALTVVVLILVVSGVAHSLGFTGSLLGVTSMQIHVGSAIAATALAVAHVFRRRQHVRAADLGRRTMLRTGALVGGGVLLWSATEATAALASLPGADRRTTGSHELGTDDSLRMPVTQWLTDSVPAVDPETFRLQVVADGRSIDLDLGDLDGGDGVRAVLDCTGGWYAAQDWSGTRLDHLLDQSVGSLTYGRSVDVVSVTGYRRRLPLSDARRLLLATRLAGRPLSPGHGAPVRLVAPDRRGFWWVKWVTRIEVVDAPWWLQPPFPGQ
ncbi:MAG TPA: molybdopterin-dependent oxidoreductase [Jiangellaceae bacterium]|jgi:DMSO/TMAO reductase YedYZ molybdopterin-dependent catalytic subunit|nr:molybdopterin-dependent oxidoreductase [Jiangellaceae bacterium]